MKFIDSAVLAVLFLAVLAIPCAAAKQIPLNPGSVIVLESGKTYTVANRDQLAHLATLVNGYTASSPSPSPAVQLQPKTTKRATEAQPLPRLPLAVCKTAKRWHLPPITPWVHLFLQMQMRAPAKPSPARRH